MTSLLKGIKKPNCFVDYTSASCFFSDQPTKMDYDVYNALKYALKNLNSKDYPNIYKWHHTVSQYDENEKKR